jgi:hypothetical protein
MKTQVIQLEVHDDVISIRDKMAWAKTDRILLVFPRQGRLRMRPLDLRLLRRYATALGVELAFVTRSIELKRLAREEGIPSYRVVSQEQRRKWETLPIPDPAEPNNKDKARKISEKALMISFYQAITQERAVYFSQAERMEGNLIPIMTGFKVERVNPSGHPVYTADKDHDVIASGLALYAFWREFHYIKGRSILETAALISGRGLDEDLPISAHLPKFRDGAVRRVRKEADDLTWSVMVQNARTEEPDERHLVKLSENGRPVTSSGAKRGGFSGRGAFTSRNNGFSRRR